MGQMTVWPSEYQARLISIAVSTIFGCVTIQARSGAIIENAGSDRTGGIVSIVRIEGKPA
jgi:hypothetical protein